ncbi:MAG: hypothetical protein K6F35_07805 [Lachnospiraceae bacterium]|nr:hypothetical protein [Lachnospiraceae bacterium]
MSRFYKDSKGRDCTYAEIGKDKVTKEADYEYAEIHGLDIDWILVGNRRMKVMLIPSVQEVHDTMFQADDREQKQEKAERDHTDGSIEEIREKAGEGGHMFDHMTTGMKPETDKYEEAAVEILKRLAEEHPERREQIRLQLEEYSRSEAARALGISGSTAYKYGNGLTEFLHGIIDDLICLQID